MEIISKVEDLKKIRAQQESNKIIGFVPTMGALHAGHMSLLKAAAQECDICICSIFVNPTQFNNTEDLEKYPNQIEQDLKLLEKYGCDIVFTPNKEEIYPSNFVEKEFDFGLLDRVMEGANRPGHFKGVAMVVSRLFDIVSPNKAYFGEKDYQQLAVINELVSQERRAIDIVSCPIIREEDGLAMSSRNLRLTTEMRTAAPRIFNRLKHVKATSTTKSIETQKHWMQKQFEADEELNLEYFEISNAKNLKPSNKWADSHTHIACIAAYAGPIRLIDNILLKIN